MNASAGREAFESLLSNDGHSPSSLRVPQGFAVLIKYYRQHRADDCPVNTDADMLLFQWGIASLEEGDGFELNLTRQFIPDGESDDENIWQLSLSFIFALSEPLRALGSGNKWCRRPRPQAVDHFESFVWSSESFRAVSELQPLQVKLDYFDAG